ncbi:MAG: phosphatidylinositol transfer protein [Amphiamblys sp. WSBS2006]|nr:MAG: phosphatidylinositol transfer protein [Amphiamblys sp. WSBS2006]
MGTLLELRILLPLSVEEYQKAQLYTIGQLSLQETGSDTGVEILKNEHFTDDAEFGSGQYTKKVIHAGSKAPKFAAAILPKSVLSLREEAWNSYPACKTVQTNDFLGKKFKITITTKHLADNGTSENVHELGEKELAKRKVRYINIFSDSVSKGVFDENPREFKSAKTGRGRYGEGWESTETQVMCCYKLVEIRCSMLGLGGYVEKKIKESAVEIAYKTHGKMICSMDEWIDLTMEDVREIEKDVKEKLDKKMVDSGLKTEETIATTENFETGSSIASETKFE